MKVSIEVGHGWCAAMSVCEHCGHEFTLVRKRSDPSRNCICPECHKTGCVVNTEMPWVGLIEEVK